MQSLDKPAPAAYNFYMAKDLIHDAVSNALTNDDWEITDEPYRLDYKNFTLKPDLAVERFSEDGGTLVRLIIEVKSFVGDSFVRELQQAIGQYTMYRDAIAMNNLDYDLYLAISEQAFIAHFHKSGTQFAVEQYQLKLLVVDVAKEKIVGWIE